MTSASVERKSVTRHPGGLPAKRAHASVAVGSKHGTSEDLRKEFNDEEWRDMVATAAYYRAEARGFNGDSTEDDWYEAEAELRERFSAGDSQIDRVAAYDAFAANVETAEE